MGAVLDLLKSLGTLVLVVLLVLVLVAWRIGRRVRRTADRVRRGAAAAHTRFLPPGPRREIALLRQRLADELESTRTMLAAAPEAKIFQADAATVLGSISAAAAELDANLVTIAGFADPQQQVVAFRKVRPQVDQLISTSYQARQTMLRTAAVERSRHLDALRDVVANEATSLRNYERGTDPDELRL